MSGLSRTPGKRVYGENRNEGSNPSLSAKQLILNDFIKQYGALIPPYPPGSDAAIRCVP